MLNVEAPVNKKIFVEDALLNGLGTMEFQDTKKCKACGVLNIESQLCIYVILSCYFFKLLLCAERNVAKIQSLKK